MWASRVSIVFLFVCGCPPSGSQQAQPQYVEPIPYYKTVRQEPEEPQGDAARLAAQCEAGKARSCSLLGSAYAKGDLYPDIGQDPSRAVAFWLKGCDLGDGDSCYSLADAYAKGNGVQPNKERAADSYRKGCNADAGRMSGFSCAKLALLLLEGDWLGNRDEAMGLFTRACVFAGQDSATCKLAESYRGTGRVSEEAPPKGAVGYAFGITSKDAAAICRQAGGKFDTKNGTVCRGQSIEALNETVLFVGLDFCKRDSLCSIQIALDRKLANVFRDYASIRDRLTKIYGVPSKIVVKTTPACRTDSVIGACLAAKDAEFSTTWGWNAKGWVFLRVMASSGSFGIVLDYWDEAGVKAVGPAGL